MSEILIKGLKIKDYPQTITINPDGSVIKDTFGLHRLVEEWKAIEVQTHGRLGDLDALKTYLDNTIKEATEIGLPVTSEYLMGLIDDAIKNAPTIIEASKEKSK